MPLRIKEHKNDDALGDEKTFCVKGRIDLINYCTVEQGTLAKDKHKQGTVLYILYRMKELFYPKIFYRIYKSWQD